MLEELNIKDFALIDFGIVNKSEIDVFLELSCFFDDPKDVGNLISRLAKISSEALLVHPWLHGIQ